MYIFLDFVPGNAWLFGPDQISPRQDLDDINDLIVLVHRNVALPRGAHLKGPNCMCSPTWRTKGEVESSAFKYEVGTEVGGFH